MGEVASDNQARLDMLRQLTTFDTEVPSWQLDPEER